MFHTSHLKKSLWGIGTAAWLLASYACTVPRYETQPVVLRVQPTPQLIQRGKVLVNLMCADCHRNPVTGALSGKFLPDVPKMMGRLYSQNITQHPQGGIGNYTDGELAFLLRTGIGRKGNFSPIMAKPGLSDADLQAIIAFLKYSNDPLVSPVDRAAQPTRYSLVAKAGMRFALRPFDYPTQPLSSPPVADTVAQGQYLVNILGCHDCHSRNMAGVNKSQPEKSKGYLGGGAKLRTLAGKTIRTPNITVDAETGIGKWSQADFVRALREGVRPDHTVLAYPMPNYSLLSEQEASALYAYLQTVPAIRHRVNRQVPATKAPFSASLGVRQAGKQLYNQYGCNACHGDTGIGIADLRKANQKYPNDEQLKDRIKRPTATQPDSRMPRFEGVIPESDFGPLLAYVRWLGESHADKSE